MVIAMKTMTDMSDLTGLTGRPVIAGPPANWVPDLLTGAATPEEQVEATPPAYWELVEPVTRPAIPPVPGTGGCAT